LDSEELRWTDPSDGPEPGTLASSGIEPDEESDDDEDFSPGTHLGRYVILARQGVGGMGVVYAAYDPQLDRRVAVKLMHRRGAGEDQKAARRLLAEAKASAQFSHPNVITVHDVGTWEGRVFLAMEFIEGAPLSKWMREPGRDWQQLLDVFTKAGRGLEAAHEAGLVHRDFKPDNVLVGIDGRVRVLDFGLARRFDGSADPLERRDREAGTPAYMSPEQHMGRALDHRSDQFSFCVALYEALYGELPFSARTRFELALAVTDGRIGPAPRGAGVPNWVRYALLRGLDPEPEGRWEDMGELLDALARDPHHGLRQLLLGLGAAFLVITSGVVLMQVSRSEPEEAERAIEDPCGFGDQRVTTVWNPDRADALRAAFADIDRPWAASLVDEVEEGFDTWSQGWAAMHRSACEATHVHHVQSDVTLDRRMLCLDRRLAEFDGVITLLSTSGPEVLVRAGEAVSELPALEPCADAQALTSIRDPPVVSEEQRAELEALDRELARASTLEFAGDYRQAGELLRSCVDRARTLGAQGRLGQALLELGEHELARGEPAVAGPWIDEAIVAAERAGDDPLRARALVAAVQVAADAGLVDEARRRAALARAVLERTDAKGVAYTDLAAAEAMTEVAAGHLADAEALLRRAINELDAIEPAPIELGDLHAELGVVLRERGDLIQARAEFELALSSWRERYGEQHPILARARVELAEVALRLGQPEQALGEYQRALALREQAWGPDSLEVGDTVEGMALVLHALARHADALPLHERAKAIYAAQGPSSAHALAQALDDEGMAHRQLGEFERAREVHELARQTWEAALGPSHPTLALALIHLGEDHLLLGQPELARPWLERALVVLEGRPEPELLGRASLARFTLARTWLPQPIEGAEESKGDLALARELAGRARADYQALGRSERVAELDAWLTEHGAI
jgi:tetratricopeptide (TPR) repeat protein/predicted Ser/Thr protein kinase